MTKIIHFGGPYRRSNSDFSMTVLQRIVLVKATLSVKLFSKLNLFNISDTLILEIYFLIVKINIFQGDLSDISAKTATLDALRTHATLPRLVVYRNQCFCFHDEIKCS